MDEDILDYALKYAEKSKIEYGEVRGQSQTVDRILLRNGKLEAYAVAEDSGFCVRIMANGGIGFASTNKWYPPLPRPKGFEKIFSNANLSEVNRSYTTSINSRISAE